MVLFGRLHRPPSITAPMLPGAALPGYSSALFFFAPGAVPFTNVQFNHVGAYTVLVSNQFGLVASAPANLYVGRIASWGANDQGQATRPPGFTNVAAVAAGNEYSLALTLDGTVIGWGSLLNT